MKRIARQASILVAVALGHVAFVVAADVGRSDPLIALEPPIYCPRLEEICLLVAGAEALGSSDARRDLAAGRLIAPVQAATSRDDRALLEPSEAERQEWEALGLKFELKASTDIPECWRTAYTSGYLERATSSLRSTLGSRFTPRVEQRLKRQLLRGSGEA